MPRLAAAVLLGVLLGLVNGGSARADEIYHVDRQSAACTDAGPGTAAIPYCSITAAIAAHRGAGVTLQVHPGVYREQVTIPASGDAVHPFVIRASGPGTVIDGSDDFSEASLWSPISATVWLASSATWAPAQVIVDGQRLTSSTADPALLPVGSYRYVAGAGLYVAGVASPGGRPTFVSRRSNGFRISGKSWVMIDGFTVLRTQERAVYLSSSSNDCTVRNVTVQFAVQGLYASDCARLTLASNFVSDVADHGIYLTAVTGSTIDDNTSFRNLKPPDASASGIYVTGASIGNVFRHNRLYGNRGSGIRLGSSSSRNLCLQNMAWLNREHGFEHSTSPETWHIGDVAWKNVQSGFTVRGASIDCQLHDCIAVENGLAGTGYDLSVDTTSTTGFASDYNIFWNSTTRPSVSWRSVNYSAISVFRDAIGLDSHSIQADPRFVDPAAGMFDLRPGSPAIDAATSFVQDWPDLDAAGRPRFDDLATVNTGDGPVSFADIGAMEFSTTGIPPTAAIEVRPATGVAPLSVIADASASRDDDGNIVSYRFEFGDGAVVGPQSEPTATHQYGQGQWTARVVVMDDDSLTRDASVPVTVTGPNLAPQGVIDAPAKDVTISAGQSVSFSGTGSDPDGPMPLGYQWYFGGGAPGAMIEDPGLVVFATPGTYTVTLTVHDAAGIADPTPATRIVTVRTPVAGIVADEIHWTFLGQTAVTFDWRGSADSIRYGLTPAYGQIARGVPPVPYPFSSGGPFWEASLTGLSENAIFHYSIGDGPDHTFRTPPTRGASGFALYAEGDIGSTFKYPRVASVQALIAAGRPDFCLLVGDLSYANNHGQVAVDTHFNDMMAWSRDAAYMPTWGNHDWEAPDNLNNYKGRFELPNPRRSPGTPAISDVGEDWYWFDYGNVRFIAYPEPWSGAFTDWNIRADSLMDAAEADSAIDFIVTCGHRPAYSSGHHSGDTKLKGYMDALGDSHSKYVLNLCGHSHDYERSYRQHGVVHVVTGTGGSNLETDRDSTGCLWGGGCPPPSWIALRAMHHVAFRLDVTDGMIRGRAICGPAGSPASPNDMACDEMTVIDSFTIVPRRDLAPVVTAPATVAAASGALLTLAVQVADPDDDAITSLTADLSHLPPGHGAVFTAAPDRRSGTLKWTPAPAHLGGPYAVSFVAANTLRDTTSSSITVFGNHSPVAVLALAPNGGSTPLTVFANASGTTDLDGDVLSYRFGFGDGAEAGPQPSPIAAHNFAPGTWNIDVIVTDAHGAADTASAPLTVGGSLIANHSFETNTQGWISNGPATVARVAGARTDGFALRATAADTIAQFGMNDSPNWVAIVAGPGVRYRYSAWVRSDSDTGQVRLKIREYKNGIQQGASQASPTYALSPQWRLLTAELVTLTTGSTIDAQILDTPVRRREIFLVDDFNASIAPSDSLPPNLPPDAALAVTPGIGAAPLAVTADASASRDPEGAPLSYRFDFGDGAVVGPQASPTALHDYAAGDWILRLTVTDGNGATDTVSTPIAARTNLVKNPSFETATSGWNATGTGATIARIAGGRTGSFTAELRGPATRGAFGINDAPNWVSPHAGPGARYRFTAWVRSSEHAGKANLRVREFLNGVAQGVTFASPAVTLSPTWQMLTFDAVAAVAGGTLDFQVIDSPLANSEVFQVDDASAILLPGFVPPNRAPSAALAVLPPIGSAPLAVVADAGGSSDPDGDPLSYRFDFGDGVVVGPQAAATAPHVYATGSWTLSVIVTDDRGAADTTSAPVTAAANLVRNPSFETSTTGWNAYGNGTPTIARIAGGHDGGFAVEARSGPVITTFGLNDAPNWVSPHAGLRSRYRFTAWVRSQSHTGKAWIRVREFLNGVAQGSVIASPLVTLSPTWQLLSVEAVAAVAGGTLDMQVVDNPIVPSEVFQIDDVSAYLVPATTSPIAGKAEPESSTRPLDQTLVFGARLSPNPPAPNTTLDFVTTRSGFARVRIFDAQGRLVRTLLDDPALAPGRHALRIETRANGARLGPGMYFYSVQATEGRLGGKFVVLE